MRPLPSRAPFTARRFETETGSFRKTPNDPEAALPFARVTVNDAGRVALRLPVTGPLRRQLTAHRPKHRLDPLVVFGVEEPCLDRVDVVRRRRRFSRAAAFLDPHLFDGIPGEDRSLLATHHIHHR